MTSADLALVSHLHALQTIEQACAIDTPDNLILFPNRYGTNVGHSVKAPDVDPRHTWRVNPDDEGPSARDLYPDGGRDGEPTDDETYGKPSGAERRIL